MSAPKKGDLSPSEKELFEVITAGKRLRLTLIPQRKLACRAQLVCPSSRSESSARNFINLLTFVFSPLILRRLCIKLFILVVVSTFSVVNVG